MRTHSHHSISSLPKYLSEHAHTRYVLNIALCLLILFLLWHTQILRALSGFAPLADLDAYYQLAQATLSGANPYQVEFMQTLGPPLVIVPFLPLALVPLEWARAFSTALSLLAAGWTCWSLSKTTPSQLRLTYTLTLLLFLLSFFPARFSLLMGQPNLIVMACLTAFVLNTQVVVGVLGSSLLKTQYLLCGFSLLRYQRNSALKAGLVGGVIFLLTLPILTPSAYRTFLSHTLAPLVRQSPELLTTHYYNQTLMVTAARIGFPSSSFLIPALLWLLSAVYLIKSGNRRAAIILSVLLAPVVWQHYFIVLFTIIILGFHSARTLLQILTISLAALLLWVEFPSFHTVPPTLAFGIAASHFSLGGIVLLLFTLYQAKKECYTSSNGKSFDSYTPRS